MKKYIVIAWIDNAKNFRVTDVTSDDRNELVKRLNKALNKIQRNIWEDRFGQCFSIRESEEAIK